MHASLFSDIDSDSVRPVFDHDKAYAAARAILEKLVAFNTVKPNPTRPAIEWIADELKAHGIRVNLVSSESDPRNHAGLVATLGPYKGGGTAFSGHIDVVPVDGQVWDTDPFTVVEKDGLLYGRGTTDMKGFVASSIATLIGWAGAQHLFEKPLQLFLSYDEETGFVSVREIVARMGDNFPRPAVAIIGEPTELGVVTAHKGTVVMTFDVHSTGNSPSAAAISSALLAFTRNITAATIADTASHIPAFTPAYTTFNAGVLVTAAEDNGASSARARKTFAHVLKADITGLGCHSSTPALGINALQIGAELADFAVKAGAGVTLRSFKGGSAPNVVPDKAQLDIIIDPQFADIGAVLQSFRDEATRLTAAYTNSALGREPVIKLDAMPKVLLGNDIQPHAKAQIKIQFRPLRASDTDNIIRAFEAEAARIAQHTGADIRMSHKRIVPPLENRPENRARDFIADVLGTTHAESVSYGTEASVFQQEGGVSAVVCGPGHIRVAHTANEALEISQLRACVGFLDRVVRRHLDTQRTPA